MTDHDMIFSMSFSGILLVKVVDVFCFRREIISCTLQCAADDTLSYVFASFINRSFVNFLSRARCSFLISFEIQLLK